MAHTPGPWKVTKDGEGVYAPETDTAITNVNHVCAPDWDEMSANMDIIAAAPELLTALRAVMDAVDTFGLKPTCTCQAMKPGHVCPYCQARAAIAKVTA